MKQRDKGMLAVAVIIGIIYWSKKPEYKAQSQYDLQRAGARIPAGEHLGRPDVDRKYPPE